MMEDSRMKVTAEIKKLFNGGKVKAAASVTIEDIFVIRNVRLVEGVNGLFISMPSHRNSLGEYKSVCFPITNDFRLRIFDAVMDAYETAISGNGEHTA
jgi:stage V sporulation protein G